MKPEDGRIDGVTRPTPAAACGEGQADERGADAGSRTLVPAGASFRAAYAHSPLRNTGTRLPSVRTPSMSILSEPIIQSMWIRLLLPPCSAICSGVSLAPSTKHSE